MKTSRILVLALTVVVTLGAATTIQAQGDVLYREIFPSNPMGADNALLDTTGWQLHYNATAVAYDGSSVDPDGAGRPNQWNNIGYDSNGWNACAAAAPGSPIDLTAVNSYPTITGEENGYFFYNTVDPGQDYNALAWTDEVAAANFTKADLGRVSWYEANNDNTPMRLAMKIADAWYVSAAAYVYNVSALGGMETGAKVIVSDFSCASWNPLTFTPGTELTRSDTLVSLPEGVVQATGIYTDSLDNYATSHRFDTFEITEAIPTEVVYREIFPSDTVANSALDTAGWNMNHSATAIAYDGSGPFVGTQDAWNACCAAADGIPTNLAGVNSDPYITDQATGFLFFNHAITNTPEGNNAIVWTDEVTTANVKKADLAEISWYESNADDTEMRLALKIADGWYVTDVTYVHNTDPGAMTDGIKMSVYDFSGANWNPLTFISGTELSRGDILVSLPEGAVQAAGIYTDELAVDSSSHRFDTFEIQTFISDEPIAGDANKDGRVDGSDVTILAGNWQVGVDGTQSATWEMGDFNGDHKVDGSDVTILAGNWQTGVTAAAASVPEPSCISLLLLGAAVFGVLHRKNLVG